MALTFCLLFMLTACHGRTTNGAASAEPASSSAPTMDTPASGDRGAPDFVDRQLTLRGAQFGGNMVLAEPAVRGVLPQGGRTSHEFDVHGGRCYRVMAVGDVEVNQIDLHLFAPDGSEVDADTRGDNYPVVGGARPFCPPNGGRYRVDVVMHSGQGAYGLEVFRTP